MAFINVQQKISSTGSLDPIKLDYKSAMEYFEKETLNEARMFNKEQKAMMIKMLKDFYITFEKIFQEYQLNNTVLQQISINELLRTDDATMLASTPIVGKKKDAIGIAQGNLGGLIKNSEDLIIVLADGHRVLQLIRRYFTGQTITTYFYVVAPDGQIHRLSEAELSVTQALTTWGGNTLGNPFSLAYSATMENIRTAIDNQRQYMSTLAASSKEIATHSRIQEAAIRIQSIKEGLKRRGVYSYVKGFDSTDSEIVEYILSLSADVNSILVPRKYLEMRKKFGGGGVGGGNTVSSIKSGDIGLNQVKFLGKGAMANYQSFSMIRSKIPIIINTLESKTREDLIKGLKKLFTEETTKASTRADITVAKIARDTIDNIIVKNII